MYCKKIDPKGFYSVLGVSQSATADEIKKAYRRKAIEKHPDQGGNSDEFAKINEAYSILSDASKRSMYDQYGSEGVSGQSGNSNSTSPEDIFAEFFSGQRQSRRETTPVTEDKSISISVSLADLYKGETKAVRIRRPAVCKSCMGHGAKTPKSKKLCHKCNGSGQETIVNQVGPGMVQQIMTTCRTCKGKGKTLKPEDACEHCQGEGYRQEEANVDVPLDSTVFHKDVIIVRAQAGCMPDATPGDLHVQIQVRNHPLYQRKGFDFITKRQISLAHALTGGEIPLTHVDGREIVIQTTPRDILNSGNVLLLRGEGMPRRDGTKGNLYVVLDLQMPHTLSMEHQKELKKILGEPSMKPPVASQQIRSPEIVPVLSEEFFENKSPEWAKIESTAGEISPGMEKISNDSYAHGQSAGRQRRRSSKTKGSRTQACETA
ncbi:chaperone protein DnaJ [Perkinsela sp. CCAP 1560/4]|nr:chaperone protein DnaJ [Perkinsela sp. CCAP 1560/4]|eukprot:KNH06302.1 chaperone protein DnaJ [Perkinsela sp. CCAP 1560/4]